MLPPGKLFRLRGIGVKLDESVFSSVDAIRNTEGGGDNSRARGNLTKSTRSILIFNSFERKGPAQLLVAPLPDPNRA